NSYTLGSWQSIESARTIAVETIKCALQWQACLHSGALAKAGRLRVICAVLSNIVVAGGADPGRDQRSRLQLWRTVASCEGECAVIVNRDKSAAHACVVRKVSAPTQITPS